MDAETPRPAHCYRCKRPLDDDCELLSYPERIDDFEFFLCPPCSCALDLWLNTPPPCAGTS